MWQVLDRRQNLPEKEHSGSFKYSKFFPETRQQIEHMRLLMFIENIASTDNSGVHHSPPRHPRLVERPNFAAVARFADTCLSGYINSTKGHSGVLLATVSLHLYRPLTVAEEKA